MKSLGLSGAFLDAETHYLCYLFCHLFRPYCHTARRFVQNGNLENTVENVSENVRKPADVYRRIYQRSSVAVAEMRTLKTSNVLCVTVAYSSLLSLAVYPSFGNDLSVV